MMVDFEQLLSHLAECENPDCGLNTALREVMRQKKYNDDKVYLRLTDDYADESQLAKVKVWHLNDNAWENAEMRRKKTRLEKEEQTINEKKPSERKWHPVENSEDKPLPEAPAKEDAPESQFAKVEVQYLNGGELKLEDVVSMVFDEELAKTIVFVTSDDATYHIPLAGVAFIRQDKAVEAYY